MVYARCGDHMGIHLTADQNGQYQKMNWIHLTNYDWHRLLLLSRRGQVQRFGCNLNQQALQSLHKLRATVLEHLLKQRKEA